MTRTQWEEIYQRLQEIHREFLTHYSDYKNGRNKKIRTTAERQLGYVIHGADYIFRSNPEVYMLATGGEKNNDYGRAIHYDEFMQFRYFGGDMGDLLRNIQLKIQSFDTPTEQNG